MDQIYLRGQKQRVVGGDPNTDGATSPINLKCGVPQGSIQGPILFVLYISPLWDLCRLHGREPQFYVDDQQIHLAFKHSVKGSQGKCINLLKNWIQDVKIWVTENMLKLNKDKTEFIIFGTNQKPAKATNIFIKISSEDIKPVDCVRNLWYFMDKVLKNANHIN